MGSNPLFRVNKEEGEKEKRRKREGKEKEKRRKREGKEKKEGERTGNRKGREGIVTILTASQTTNFSS